MLVNHQQLTKKIVHWSVSHQPATIPCMAMTLWAIPLSLLISFVPCYYFHIESSRFTSQVVIPWVHFWYFCDLMVCLINSFDGLKWAISYELNILSGLVWSCISYSIVCNLLLLTLNCCLHPILILRMDCNSNNITQRNKLSLTHNLYKWIWVMSWILVTNLMLCICMSWWRSGILGRIPLLMSR